MDVLPDSVKLQPQIFSPLQPGDRVSLGQGDKITFMFRVQQHSAICHKKSYAKLRANKNYSTCDR
ncbi:hypothetical protein [Nostoc sp.]|uniref:hypothetical protein n=1 Tax=Nostoc sp. TaxID=1180 RepID=UPI002FF4D722